VVFSIKRLTAVFVIGSVCSLGLWGQAKQPQWKDRAEYDLYDSILKTQDNNTKLGLLQSWEQKYPQTDYLEARHQLTVQTFQALGKAKEMMDAAKKMAAAVPKSFFALYWINLLTVSMNDTSPAALADGEKYAKEFLGIMDATFDPSKKKAEVSEDAWKKERATMESLAYRAIGWVAMSGGKNEDAEKAFEETLKRNPGDAQAAIWTATVIIRQKKIEKQSEALFYYARAAAYDGQGALPQASRDQIMRSFEKNYVNFHGGKDKMDEVLALAKANAVVPDGFKVLSQDEILQAQEKELETTNPQLAVWVKMKRGLTGPDGASYFASSVKDSNIPGGIEVAGQKIEKLKGTVVSSTPSGPRATTVKEVVVGISQAEMSEATLKFETPQPKIDPGTVIEFAGVPTAFAADPFMVTFEVDAKDVTGWPKPAAPAKRPAAAKKPAAKK
jgi:tetratricopeptide (TPR) repeat protein